MLPADQVEALESLVDEIEPMPVVRKGPVGLGRKQHTGEGRCRRVGGDGREHGALGTLAMANRHPAPQPALEHGEVRPAGERTALPPRRLAVAIGRDPPNPMKQRQVGFLFGQHRQEIADGREDRHPDAPAVAAARAEQRRLAQDFPRRHAGREQAMHGLGDHEAEILGHAVVEAPVPVGGRIRMAEAGLDPDVAVPQLDRAGRHVVRPWIEGAAACQVEAGVMPVAGQDAVLDAAAVEREAHMRAPIVEGENTARLVNHENRPVAAMNDEAALGFQLFECPGPHVARSQFVHAGLHGAQAIIARTALSA